MTSGAAAYNKVGVETGVAAANPHKLIVMLFDGALISIGAAIQQMQAGDIQAKGQSISKAISIIDNGLRASLDKKIGGELALNLDALYEYMTNRLLIANAKNQVDVLEEIRQLLKGLKDAWDTLPPAASTVAAETDAPAHSAQAEPAASAPKAGIYDTLAPRSSNLVKA